MKKFLIFMLFIMPLSYAREEVPILPLDRGVDIRYSDDSLDLINTDKMRRSKAINEAKEELKEKPVNTIQIDMRYLKHQRALDYITRPNNYFMPPVL